MDGDKRQKPLHVRTPLIESHPMSKHAGFTVHLKLENTQPTATFKLRGIGHLIQKSVQNGCKRVVCSSGGNAGLAAAYAARKMKIPATIYIPGSTPEFIAERLREEGAEVLRAGSVWDHANEAALAAAKDDDTLYVHPFDHPDTWAGHSSMIIEAAEDLSEKPDVVVASVGGGGLMLGILQGMEQVGWGDVPFVAMETIGADCFSKAIEAGKLVTLPDITSIAKCLGALTVAKTALEAYSKRRIISKVVTDKQAVEACVRFLDDQRMLVQPACGAALSAIYSDVIKQLVEQKEIGPVKNAVVIVCGGQTASLEMLKVWKEKPKLREYTIYSSRTGWHTEKI